MRAVVCEQWGGPETLKIMDRELPPPGPGQVTLLVRGAGLNFPDVLIIQAKYQVKPELPFTLGAECAGEVIAVGPDVTSVQIGDRVAALCSTGAFAEQALVDAAACIKLPDGVTEAAAGGFVLAYGTSWHALRDRARLQPGETLLVLGAAGGVGLSAVDIGVAMGARVIAAASTEEKLGYCRAYGVTDTIVYGTGSEQGAALRAGLKQLAAAPDVIYDPVGGALTEASFRSIGWRGRHLMIGFADGTIPALPANLPLLKGASLVGVFWGAYTKREAAHWAASSAEMMRWLAEGRLRPLVSRRCTLEEVPQALADMAARRVVGKVLVLP
jgi:NADPH2:quinone reductase